LTTEAYLMPIILLLLYSATIAHCTAGCTPSPITGCATVDTANTLNASSGANCGCLTCNAASQIMADHTCQACSTLGVYCYACANSTCTDCDSRAGVTPTGQCIFCSTLMYGCAACNLMVTPNTCSGCYGNFFYNSSNLCQECAVFIYQCYTCTSNSACTSCNRYYGFNSTHECDICRNYIDNCS
jgi:hypothetical protein